MFHLALPRCKDGKMTFLCVGAQRAGTSTLNRLLRLHPEVETPYRGFKRIKEIHYFDSNDQFRPEELSPSSGDYEFLHRHFRFVRKAAGETTPSYAFAPCAIERIQAYNPNIRLVFLVRNPINRAFSQWNMNLRKGHDDYGFMEALRAEPERAGRLLSRRERNLAYIARSRFGEQIKRILDHFPADQLKVVKSEDFYKDTPGVFGEICDFIGVNPARARFDRVVKKHAAAEYKARMSTEAWDFLYDALKDDIDLVERLLGWHCDDWRVRPGGV